MVDDGLPTLFISVLVTLIQALLRRSKHYSVYSFSLMGYKPQLQPEYITKIEKILLLNPNSSQK